MGAARATLTREDSEWSRKFEEPWQSRPWDWRGVGVGFSPKAVLKGLPSPFNAAGWRCSYLPYPTLYCGPQYHHTCGDTIDLYDKYI